MDLSVEDLAFLSSLKIRLIRAQKIKSRDTELEGVRQALVKSMLEDVDERLSVLRSEIELSDKE
jgi:hypothetical protein